MASLSLRPRRLAISHPINWPLWAGIVGGVLAGFLVWQYLTAVNPLAEVLVFNQSLEPGTVITADHLSTTGVQLDGRVLAAYIPRTELGSVVGTVAQERVHAGTLVARAQVGSGNRLAADQLALSFAIKPENAAGGAVRPGSAVMVVVQGRGAPEIVLENLRVYDIQRGSGLIVSVAVTREQMLRLLEARARGETHLLLQPVGLPPVPMAVTAPASAPVAPATTPAPATLPTPAPTAAPSR